MGLFYKVSVFIYIWSKLVQNILELSKLALTEMVQIGPNLPKVAKLLNLYFKTLLGGLLTKRGATLEV